MIYYSVCKNIPRLQGSVFRFWKLQSARNVSRSSVLEGRGKKKDCSNRFVWTTSRIFLKTLQYSKDNTFSISNYLWTPEHVSEIVKEIGKELRKNSHSAGVGKKRLTGLWSFRPVCHPPTRSTCVTNTPWYRDRTRRLRRGRTRRRRRRQQCRTFTCVENCWPASQSSESIWRSCRFLRTTRGRSVITTIIKGPFSETVATYRTSKSRGSKWGRNNARELCLPGEFSKRTLTRGRVCACASRTSFGKEVGTK